ncbi:MAG: flagellar hook-associated protein 2 [Chlamydiales bacterium]|jgi:flagellar hook-associated protein 2
MTSPTASSDGKIRLGGLSSGFDTDSIVNAMLASDQSRIDKLLEDVEINKAKKSTWEDITEQLRTMSETVTKLKATGVTGQTLFDDKLMTSSNTAIASGVAAYTASKGSYSINITAIAQAHVIYGTQKAAGYTLPTAGTFLLNGTTITVNSGESLTTIANRINLSDFPSGEELQANIIDNRLVIQTENTGASKAVYGTATGSPPFVIATDDPDSILQNDLEIIDGTGNFINVAQTSADAALTINGVPLNPEENTVDDAVRGLTINLLSTGSAVINITHNTEKVKAVVSDFVDLYNESRDLITRIRTAKLSEDDLFGLFSNDPLLRSMYSELRSLTTLGVTFVNGDWEGALSAQAASASATSLTVDNFEVDGSLSVGDIFVLPGHSENYKLTANTAIAGGTATMSFFPPLEFAVTAGQAPVPLVKTLEDIGVGVRTDTVSGIEGVLGILDEAKLDTVLTTDMDTIDKLFSRFHADKPSHLGVGRRVYDWIDSQIKISAFVNKTRSIEDITIPGLTARNDGIAERITRLEASLEQKREGLIRKFAEMENSISKSQSFGAAIGGLSGGGA